MTIYSPDEIQHLIEALEQRIRELRFQPVLNAYGEVVSYADLEASL